MERSSSQLVFSRSAPAIVAVISLSMASFLPASAHHSSTGSTSKDNRLIAGFPFSNSSADDGKSTDETSISYKSAQKEEKKKAKKAAKQSSQPSTQAKSAIVPAIAANSALMSLLKDLSRSLTDSEQASKIQDSGQKIVIELARQVLTKSLDDSRIKPNRIVENDLGPEKSMTAQAWTSGDIPIGNGGHASIAAVWAKRENGLLNVTIAGHVPNEDSPSGKVREFIVILSGHSSFEKGFDIQSQSNVNFWLAKLASLNIESDYRKGGEAAKLTDKVKDKQADDSLTTKETTAKETEKSAPMSAKHLISKSPKNSVAVKGTAGDDAKVTAKADSHSQSPVVTEPAEKASVEAHSQPAQSTSPPAEVHVQLTQSTSPQAEAHVQPTQSTSPRAEAHVQPIQSTPLPAEGHVQLIQSTPSPAEGHVQPAQSTLPPAEAHVQPAQSTSPPAKAHLQPAQNSPPPAEYILMHAVSPTVMPEKKAPIVAPVAAPLARIQIPSSESETKVESHVPPAEMNRPPIAAAVPDQNIGWAGSPALITSKQPIATSLMVLPGRAVAGQYLTASVIDSNKVGKPGMEMSFNGASKKTDTHGHANFMVPEDATPGHSLNVALSASPEVKPGQIEILQPLTLSAQQETPRIDHTTPSISATGTLTIDGHNFDGVAEHNKVTIDGSALAEVSAASPVQLRILLPTGLKPGSHTIVVDTDGLSSNDDRFDLVMAEVMSDSKESSKDQLTKKSGRKNPVHDKLAPGSSDPKER